MAKKLVNYMGVRVDTKTRTTFAKKAIKFGGTSETLRALIEGFADDRVSITAPEPSGIFTQTVTKESK